jgi:DNA mismatch repair protein MutS
MKFNIDQQSFTDLNIFSSSSNTEAIVNLFKHTKTIGGREMVYEMMRNPSSDLTFLRNRTAAISWFLEHHIVIEISSHQLDLIDHHLKHDKRHLKANIIDATVDFIRDKISSGADYYIVQSGLANFRKLAKFLKEYLQVVEETNAPEGLRSHAQKITEILELPAIKRMIAIRPKKLRFYHISKLDGVFRKQLKKELNELLRLVYELDVYETLAYIIEQKNLCLPKYLGSGSVSLSVEALYHPGIIGAVTNDVEIEEHNNMTFLTGSNMAGKSSFLKATGLCIFLAHIGFPVFAKSMSTTIFNGIITTINLPDNLSDGLSHYYTEVKRVKETALQLRDVGKVFVIFDELFRGTNVKDAFDASLLVINELTQVKSSVFLISTHIVELAEELKKHKNVSFKYMDTFFEGQHPVFTYKLMTGISQERLGMYIVKNEGIVEIIQEAVRKQ